MSCKAPSNACTQTQWPRVASAVAAGPEMFQTETTSAVPCVAPVAQPLLNIYHQVVRRQDTPSTCVDVKQLFMRDMRAAQVLSSQTAVRAALAWEGSLKTPQPGPVGQSGQLCLQLRCAQTSSTRGDVRNFFGFILVREDRSTFVISGPTADGPTVWSHESYV